MTEYAKSFEFIKSDDVQQPETLSGHLTMVHQQKTLTGDIVVKNLSPKTKYMDINKEDTPQRWLDSQKNAKKIADEIRAKNNPAYFVPKTFIAHGKVREQFASGKRWCDVFKTLSPQDKEWACKAIAELINDMSELRPVKYNKHGRNLPSIAIKGPEKLAEMLQKCDDKYISKANKKLIQDIYEYLMNVPENKMMVFSHNDLNGGNIIIDLEKRQVSVIDFEMAGYSSAFDIMYSGMFDSPGVWQYINHLPRSNNTKLSWNFVPEHGELYKFIRWGWANFVRDGMSLEQMSDTIKKNCDKVRFVFAQAKARAKMSAKKEKMPLVPMSHYEKDN